MRIKVGLRDTWQDREIPEGTGQIEVYLRPYGGGVGVDVLCDGINQRSLLPDGEEDMYGDMPLMILFGNSQGSEGAQ